MPALAGATVGTRVWRLVARGVVAAAVAFTAGLGSEWYMLGRTGAEAATRLEASSRRALDRRAASLDASATALAGALSAAPAAAVDPEARGRLFAAAAAAADPGADTSVTVYDGMGAPLAWAGRPSDLDRTALAGRAWTVSRTPLGPRLRRVLPVDTGEGDDRLRLGTVVAEQPLTGPGTPGPAVDAPIVIDGDPSLPVRFAAADAPGTAGSFLLASPDGTPLLAGVVQPTELAAARARWRDARILLAAAVLALAVLLALAPILAWRATATAPGGYLQATLLVLIGVAAARGLLAVARPTSWDDSRLFADAVYGSFLLEPLLASPIDFLLTGLTAAAVAALLVSSVAAWRRAGRPGRRALDGPAAWGGCLAAQLAAGLVVAAALVAQRALLAATIDGARLDLLRFSLHPWDSARMALQAGLLVWHGAALGLAVAALLAALVPWRVPRGDARAALAVGAAWLGPAVVVVLARGGTPELARSLPALAAISLAAWHAPRVAARFRRGSQALRLSMLLTALAAPALLVYPMTAGLTGEARARLVAERWAPQALAQRETLQGLLAASLDEIDALPGLRELYRPASGSGSADPAFDIWRQTQLAAYPVTSSVELYDGRGVLFARYAFNLPDDLVAPPTWSEPSCEWAVLEEVSPFFADERRMLHAGRAVCLPDGTHLGSLVVHAVVDYENLPFIPSANPYLEAVGATDPLVGEGLPGDGLEYAVYGWSRTPLYASADRAWPLPDEVFSRLKASRDPVRAELIRDDRRYDAYLVSDRFGIYALGLPVPTPLDHLVNLAELTVLAAVAFLVLLAHAVAGRRLAGLPLTGRALIREVRASFYRKLFLAFVGATVVPVILLAVVTRTYVAGELRAGVEDAAVRAASAARRVVEDLAAPRAAQQGVAVDDNLTVWVSRLIDQDVNIFAGDTLLATSERNLFAGGLLPSRTPADLYRTVVLGRQGAAVGLDRIGAREYMVAATPLPALPVDGMLTVPLTSQQQTIEGQIDTLDRRVLLAVLLLIFGGAGVGYTMAERIADPVNRLTRATRRIARGDLGVRIAPTSSDELRRLVQDFNQMAGELQRQRAELERRHRLAAWAEMASQVAHEIKNPLTPIQLQAEYLRRVHEDQGAPLGPVVAESTATILDQVRLLRRIASDFSTFAASPVARPGRVPVGDLLEEVLGPYRRGLENRVRFVLEVSAAVPDVWVDRTLVARALTNLVENAVHAMPGTGSLTVRVQPEPAMVRIEIADTGVGMDEEALARAFEPSFSTKMTGTGLGLPIARRNVELCQGTIAIASETGRGATVTVRLPVADGPEDGA